MSTLGCMCKNMHVCVECCEQYYKNKFIPVCSVCKRIDMKRDCNKIITETRKIAAWNHRFFGWFLSQSSRERYVFRYLKNNKKEFLDVHDAVLEELCDVKEEISWIQEHEVRGRRIRVECGVKKGFTKEDNKNFPRYWKAADDVYVAYIMLSKVDK